MIRLLKADDASVIKTVHDIEARKLHSTEDVEVMHLRLKPRESLLKHSTPVDVFFYILSGSGIVEIGDEQAEVFKDTLIESPKLNPHRFINNTDEDLVILVVKTPKPTEPSKII
ncbi:MAG: cupin domain-containing protein [Candidatus Coatesbacteria bacterium]|nr:cupin domain-containing protein [Candidatus Coatesbacteria bacterium]